MGISNFKKGTRQKVHVEQQKLIENAEVRFVICYWGIEEQIYWFGGNEQWNKCPPPQKALFSHNTSEILQSGLGMARHVYTNASKKYSQNVDWKLGSNTMLFEVWKICINLAEFLAIL